MAPVATPLPAMIPDGRELLAGRVVVVTAAAGTGIGHAAALRAGLEGADLVISDQHPRRLAETATTLRERLGRAVASVECDVTHPNAFESLLDFAEARHGRVDVLVNNAGRGGAAALRDMTDSQWDAVLDVTLTSAFRGTRAALRRMAARGRGAIINVASVTGWRAEAGQAHYAAAKAGVMALTRCAAVEAAAVGVRVNAVAPTLAMHPFLSKSVDAETLESWVRVQPQGRAAEPDEIASVIAFLASDYASYLTGEVLSVGGQHP